MTSTINKRLMTMMRLVTIMVFFCPSACEQGAPRIEAEGAQAVISPFIIGSASVFVLIENKGKGSDFLERAQIDIPGSLVELHTLEEGKMRKTDRIKIPAESIVRLKPSGDHIMLYKLPGSVHAGTVGTLTLVFRKTGQLRIAVEFINTR